MLNPLRNVYPDQTLDKKYESDSARPDFWSQRYSAGKTPWQLDRVPAQLESFIRSLPAPRNVLVPGCGRDDQTIAAFSRSGHRVTAIDFSPVAVESTRKALPELGDKIVLGDFFSHDFKDAPFDLVYERTFLCSLPPSVWNDYATRVGQLLRPGGKLVGFFFYGQELEPPPYPLSEQKAHEIFDSRFKLQTSKPATDSLAIFGGNERWQEWQLL